MSAALILGCIWAVASAIVAMLPMRHQYVPGVALLIAAPVLLVYIGYLHGVWVAFLGLAAFASMFRNPLMYLFRRSRGERPEIPK
ncbi:DUF2484 family protein [Pseudogemmobacter sp. W21_MBD1_M6]|uniref:DUF2484 family protein n=1 Tax=Pseudogemmobacter sp. W21_MBD1_M6 TaxID=3240271 RepID=UPI003F9CD212